MRNQAEQEQRVKDITAKLIERFGMEWVTIVNSFDTKHESERVICTTTCDWEYRQATLRWNLPIVVTQTDKALQETAVHELVHVLIAPLWCSVAEDSDALLPKLNELSTENVARVISRLL